LHQGPANGQWPRGEIEDLLHSHAGRSGFRLELSGPAPEGAPTPLHVRVLYRDHGWVVVDVDPAVQPDAAWRELLFLGWPIDAITREGGGLEVYRTMVPTGGALAGTDATMPEQTA
jgi:hypothetical protein